MGFELEFEFVCLKFLSNVSRWYSNRHLHLLKASQQCKQNGYCIPAWEGTVKFKKELRQEDALTMLFFSSFLLPLNVSIFAKAFWGLTIKNWFKNSELMCFFISKCLLDLKYSMVSVQILTQFWSSDRRKLSSCGLSCSSQSGFPNC